MKIYLGVDPGASGGFAIVRDDGHAESQKFGDLTERDIWDAIKAYTLSPDVGLCVLEDVHAMPDQGVSSSFTFGTSYGFLRGLLAASACPYELVSPQRWQKMFGLPTTKSAGGKTAKKNFHKAKAQQLFPQLKITHAVADALLLAEYAKRTYAMRSAA